MANINIKIPDEVHKELKFEAVKKDSTLKNIIIQKLRRFSEKNVNK